MKLDTLVALLLVILELGSFAGIILLCALFLRVQAVREEVAHVVDTVIPKRKPKKRKPVLKTEEQEVRKEESKRGEATWG